MIEHWQALAAGFLFCLPACVILIVWAWRCRKLLHGSVNTMTIDRWIDALKYSGFDSIKDRLDCVELIELLQELKERRCGMNLGVFWQRIETAIANGGNCDVCPVNEYAKETNTERMCDKVGDCADGLMMLHKVLQSEERQKMERDSNGKVPQNNK